jgi:hypothetical protein
MAIRIVGVLSQTVGREKVIATGSVQRRSVRAPHTISRTTRGSRTQSGTGR